MEIQKNKPLKIEVKANKYHVGSEKIFLAGMFIRKSKRRNYRRK